MLMKDKTTGDLVRVEDVNQLASPLEDSVRARRQAGEEEQDPKPFAKRDLSFPSGEQLPQCWLDEDYQL